MTFELSKEHEDFRGVVREFAAERVAPHVAEWDEQHRFPVELVPEMGDLGLFGLVVPEEFGGAGGDFTSLCVAIEELGRVDQSVGHHPVRRGRPRDQPDPHLREPGAEGALAARPRRRPGARRVRPHRARGRLGRRCDPDPGPARGPDGAREWVVDGAKAFITNSGTPITSVVTVTARTGERPDGGPEISAIMVPAGTPGFTVEPAYRKLGWHASDTHGLTFEGCRVPEENLLGERGRGFQQFLATLDDGRIAISALAVGLARACLEACQDYARTRIAFGRPIGANQGVAFAIADLAVAVEAARLLTYRAAWLKDEHTAGRRSLADVKQAAAIAKLHSSTAAVDATRVATQVFGGSGFIEEYPVARFYRDAKILEIGEGTSEVQRLVIARGLGLPVD